MNISSLVVDARPESVVAVREALCLWPGIEVHAATPAGKLIVTIEADSDSASVRTFEHIAGVAGVLSVAMAYHQFEPHPELELADDPHDPADAT